MPFYYDIPQRKQPATQELESGDEWVLMRPFIYERPNGDRIYVPAGGIGSEQDILNLPIWTTDYGSIPRPFRNLFSPVKFGGPYILHDWLYASEAVPRKVADWILLEALQESGANWITRNTIYSAVRAGGWLVWARHDVRTVCALREYAAQAKYDLAAVCTHPGCAIA